MGRAAGPGEREGSEGRGKSERGSGRLNRRDRLGGKTFNDLYQKIIGLDTESERREKEEERAGLSEGIVQTRRGGREMGLRAWRELQTVPPLAKGLQDLEGRKKERRRSWRQNKAVASPSKKVTEREQVKWISGRSQSPGKC